MIDRGFSGGRLMVKHAPFAGLRGDIDRSVMAMNNGSGEHEPDAGALFTLGGKKSLEHPGSASVRPFRTARIRHLIGRCRHRSEWP
jgi:hypothetical protein